MADPAAGNSSPQTMELQDGEVHVWKAHLDCEEASLRRLEATLSTEETARADRFFAERDRNSFVTTRGILRELLGRYLKCTPAQIEFCYGPKGKPFLPPDPCRLTVQFNVSHCHGLALLAFTPRRNLGVDVERVRAEIAAEEIAERYFLPKEVAELRALHPSLHAEAFFLCWTRKEAYIKARGEGLHIPLESFRVSLTPGKAEKLESPGGARCGLQSIQLDEAYVGALVGEGCDWE